MTIEEGIKNATFSLISQDPNS